MKHFKLGTLLMFIWLARCLALPWRPGDTKGMKNFILPDIYKNGDCSGNELPKARRTDRPPTLPPLRKRDMNKTKRVMIYFTHIHKAGGTTLCAFARKNREVIGPKNCMIDPDLVPGSCWTRVECNQENSTIGEDNAGIISDDPFPHVAELPSEKIAGGTLQDQCNFVTGTRLTFFSDEKGSPDFLLPGFTSFTVLRRPLDRLLSHYNHSARSFEGQQPGFPKTVIEFVNQFPDMNNFIVRALSGRSHYNDEITEWHYQRCVERLEKEYSFVIILEKFDPLGIKLLEAKLGWHIPPRHSHGSKRKSNAESELPPADLSKLKELNLFDIRLYKYANALFEKQVASLGLKP
eukprot:m.180094 g.180094  ORF g.180094 m.180094 type:complete len:349 (-) comp15491_c0_seq4:2361-3407(-)